MMQDIQGWLILLARIALPIVVFFITFGPKIDAWLSSWGPHYSRDEMLRHWKVTQGCERPPAFSNLNLATAETAPSLFQKPEPPRPKAKPKAREGRDKASEKERSGERGEKADFEKQPLSDDLAGGRPAKTQEVSSRKSSADKDIVPEEDKSALRRMHFESLVNFVAFNRKDPQRVFLPAGDPPPPPRKSPAEAAEVSGKDVLQANREAQMVLHGVLEMEASGPNSVLGGVARSLSDQLSAASVEILSETFGLMVRSCIKVVDLPSCSDFLLRMEAAGLALDGELLDQVMELYWSQKKQSQEPTRNDSLNILPQHLRSAAEQYQPRQDAASSSSSQPVSLQGMQQTFEQLSQSSHFQAPLAGLPLQHIPVPASGGGPIGHMPIPSFAHNQVPVMGTGMMSSGPAESFSANNLGHGGWNSAGLSAAGPRKRVANGDAGRRVDPDLPAFSVPEEFASKAASDAATSRLSSDAPEFQPDASASELFEQMLSLAKQGDISQSSGLSPEAHEFRPGQMSAAVREVGSSAHAKGTKITNRSNKFAESSAEQAMPNQSSRLGVDRDVRSEMAVDKVLLQ